MNIKSTFFTFFKKASLHQVFFVYLGFLLNGTSLFLVNIFLGRILEKNLFGIFALSILVLSTVAEMSDFGLNGGLLRFAPYYIAQKEENKLKQLVKTIWQWRVWLSVILTCAGVVFSPFLAMYIFNNPEITKYLAFSFLGVGGVVLVGFTSTYLQARQKFLTNSLVQSLKGLLRLILVLVCYACGVQNVFIYLLIYIAVPWVLFLYSYKYLPNGFRVVEIEDETKRSMHAQLAKFSFWLTIWSLSAILASRIDQVMLSRLMGLDKVAVYAIAFQFVYIYSLILQSVTAVLMPKINGLQTKGELWLFSKRILLWIVPLILFLIPIIFISQYVVSYIFGAKYVESIPVYMVLSYSMLISLIGIPASLIITVFNKTKLVAYSGFLQLIVNLLLNIILIPRFGVMGAAYTFGLGVLVSLVYNLVCAIFLFKREKLSVI